MKKPNPFFLNSRSLREAYDHCGVRSSSTYISSAQTPFVVDSQFLWPSWCSTASTHNRSHACDYHHHVSPHWWCIFSPSMGDLGLWHLTKAGSGWQMPSQHHHYNRRSKVAPNKVTAMLCYRMQQHHCYVCSAND